MKLLLLHLVGLYITLPIYHRPLCNGRSVNSQGDVSIQHDVRTLFVCNNLYSIASGDLLPNGVLCRIFLWGSLKRRGIILVFIILVM